MGFKANTAALSTGFQGGHVHLIPCALPIISQHCSREPSGWRGNPESEISGFKPSLGICLVMDPELLSVLASIRFHSLISETTSNLSLGKLLKENTEKVPGRGKVNSPPYIITFIVRDRNP